MEHREVIFEKCDISNNTIELLDGRTLECFPLPEGNGTPLDNTLQLDTTGQYLAIGRKPVRNAKSDSAEEERLNRQKLFTDNAFYLLAHRERTLSDSRMFLTPVDVVSGLAYSGTSGFRKPTVGVYLEWWATCNEAMQTDSQGRMGLVFHIAGSPLSGANSCTEVFQDGSTAIVHLSSFGNAWGPFMRVNKRYDEAKACFQAYSLEELLDILHQEDSDNVSTITNVKELFLQREIENRDRKIERLKEELADQKKQYDATILKVFDKQIREAYAEYKTIKTQLDEEIASLREQKHELKVKLKSQKISGPNYQQSLKKIKSDIGRLEEKVENQEREVESKVEPFKIRFLTIEEYLTRNDEQ